MPHELTPDEVRAEFLADVRRLVAYCDGEVRCRTRKEALELLAFSILAMLDGGSGDGPVWILAPLGCTEEERLTYRDPEEDWYPDNTGAEIKANIAGELHERWHDRPGASKR